MRLGKENGQEGTFRNLYYFPCSLIRRHFVFINFSDIDVNKDSYVFGETEAEKQFLSHKSTNNQPYNTSMHSKHSFVMYVRELWSFYLVGKTILFQIKNNNDYKFVSFLPSPLALVDPISQYWLSLHRMWMQPQTSSQHGFQDSSSKSSRVELSIEVHSPYTGRPSRPQQAHFSSQIQPSSCFWCGLQAKNDLTCLNCWKEIKRRMSHDT